MISKSEFNSATAMVSSSVLRRFTAEPESTLVNDVHSQLNSTEVLGIAHPQSQEEVQNIVHTARNERRIISVAGGRHAMGGQQFGSNTLLVDVRKLNRVLNLDREHGIMNVEAGIEWPELVDTYLKL